MGTAPPPLLPFALEFVGPLLILTLLVGLACLRFDHPAVDAVFLGLFALGGLMIMFGLILSPAFGQHLLTGRYVSLNGMHSTSYWYAPWVLGANVVVLMVRKAIRRRRDRPGSFLKDR